MDERKEKLLKACGFYPLANSTAWNKTWGDTDFSVDIEWDYDKLVEKIRRWGWLPAEFNKPELPSQRSMQRIFFDAEFTGLHRESTLISIGFITDDDYTFYAEFTDYKDRQCTPWIQENVIKNLRFNKGVDEHGAKKGKIFTSSVPNPKAMVRLEDGERPKARYSCEMLGDTKEVAEELLCWLNNQHVLNFRNDPIQFITDCYAYDWMMLVDLLTEGETAMDMPEYLHYIPIDLSTLLYAAGVDPDISREEFAGIGSQLDINTLKFKAISKDEVPSKKHNALWDAFMIRTCFNRIRSHKVPGDVSILTYN